MNSWDAKMVLNKYIYDYMKKRNLHSTAEIFRAEADISSNPVSIDSDEGFLREWWYIFWSVYSSRITETGERNEVPPEISSLVPSSDSDPMFDMWSAVPPGFQPLPPHVSPSVTVPGPGIGGFPGRSDILRMMPTPGLRLHASNFSEPSGLHVAAVPQSSGPATLIPANNSNFNTESDRVLFPTDHSHAQKKNRQISVTGDNKCAAVEPQIEPRDIADASISEQGHIGVPPMDLDNNPYIFNVGNLSRLLSASTKFNYPHPDTNEKKAQCSASRDEGIVGIDAMRSIAAVSSHQTPKAIPQPKSETVQSGSSSSSNPKSSGSGPSS